MLKILSLLPKNLLSRLFGIFARWRLPVGLRKILLGKFAEAYAINIDECEYPISDYASFDAFFTRRLKPGLRPMDKSPDAVLSPVDGKLDSYGTILENSLIQAKGIDYTLEQLLQSDDQAKLFHNGFFATIYLSPQDYHRIHACVPGKVIGYGYIPGALWPVNAAAVTTIKRLFAVNERVITYQQYEAKRSMAKDENKTIVTTIMVGAYNVGRMELSYCGLYSNEWQRRGFAYQNCEKKNPDENIYLGKGDELGIFHLGSTVILLFSAGQFQPFALEPGKRLRVGQKIGRLL